MTKNIFIQLNFSGTIYVTVSHVSAALEIYSKKIIVTARGIRLNEMSG
jgi:hypothetical protein